jgi:16S rRNA U1498 N3-methylase RsmE
MADREAVLQAIPDSVAKPRTTIEIEEQSRRLQDWADSAFRAARQCEDAMVHPLLPPPNDLDCLISFQLLFSTTADVIH